MTQSIAIALGGAAGSLLRFWVSTGVYGVMGRQFPWGTLAVNIIGSLVMGIVYILFLERLSLAVEWRAAVQIGVLGGFTTFSAFSIETVNLIEQGDHLRALLNAGVSVIACVGAAWVGVVLARQI